MSRRVTVLCATLFAAACSGGSTAPEPPPPPSVSGTWAYNIRVSEPWEPDCVGRGELSLHQEGQQVTGRVNAAVDCPDPRLGNVMGLVDDLTGSFDPQTMVLRFQLAESEIVHEGILSEAVPDTTITGTLTSGADPTVRGTWRAER